MTVEPVPGSSVTLGGASFDGSASNITLHNFITSEVDVAAGASHITIDHNDISGGGEGVNAGGVNCSVPNAPTYSGCTPTPFVSYLTISNNKIHGYGSGGGEDAIHLNNWQHVTVTANDIYNLEEHGNHTDALQSVFGGSDMVFDHNYEHDNQSQGFFLKDGDVSNVTVSDNLFLRNNNEPSLYPGGENNIQVFDTSNFVLTKNTSWDGQGDLVRADSASMALSVTVNHNVMQLFSKLTDSGSPYSVNEDYDVFQQSPFTFSQGAHTLVTSNPGFTNIAADDYRLASNPNGIGVDWKPSDYVYGPTGN